MVFVIDSNHCENNAIGYLKALAENDVLEYLEKAYQESLKEQYPRHGDICYVNMPVKCYFEYSDKIIDKVDLETGRVTYKEGFYMTPIMEDEYVYEGQPVERYCNVFQEYNN